MSFSGCALRRLLAASNATCTKSSPSHIERRVETTAGDVSYAFRTFRRAPLPALTIVATAALGLGLASTAVEALPLSSRELLRPARRSASPRPRVAA